MRGADSCGKSLFTPSRLKGSVQANHPRRPIRTWVSGTLAKRVASFPARHEAKAEDGRPSIAPDKLIRARLLQRPHGARGKRQRVEPMQYNLPFRWLIGEDLEDIAWNHAVLNRNRDRLIAHGAVTALFNVTADMAQQHRLQSGEHSGVDDTLIQARASHKGTRRKNGSEGRRPPEDRRGDPGSDHTRKYPPNPQVRLHRKGRAAPALLSDLGHMLTDDRDGLAATMHASASDGPAGRGLAAQTRADLVCAAKRMVVGADRAFDPRGFVKACRVVCVTPHVSRNFNRDGGSIIDRRTMRPAGCEIIRRKRNCTEPCFARGTVIVPLRQVTVQGRNKSDWSLTLTTAAYKLAQPCPWARLRPQCSP